MVRSLKFGYPLIFQKLLPCCRYNLRDQYLYYRGLRKIDKTLDVVTMLKTQNRLKVLEKMVFNSRQ